MTFSPSVIMVQEGWMKCLALGVVALSLGCIVQEPAYRGRTYSTAPPASYPYPAAPDSSPPYGAAPSSGSDETPPETRRERFDPDRAYGSAEVEPQPVQGYDRDQAQGNVEIGPQFVRVSILGALIAPSKADGRPWDGPGRVDPTTMNTVGRLLGARNAYAVVFRAVTEMSMDALAKPDPYGYVQLLVPEEAARVPLPLIYRDTFTPSWPHAELGHVPLRQGVRIRVTLIDKDLAEDDFIGAAELTQDDMRAGLQAGMVHPVQVAAQTANQLLFISISVAAE